MRGAPGNRHPYRDSQSLLFKLQVGFVDSVVAHRPNSKLEAAYHKADKAIDDVIDLLAAA